MAQPPPNALVHYTNLFHQAIPTTAKLPTAPSHRAPLPLHLAARGSITYYVIGTGKAHHDRVPYHRNPNNAHDGFEEVLFIKHPLIEDDVAACSKTELALLLKECTEVQKLSEQNPQGTTLAQHQAHETSIAVLRAARAETKAPAPPETEDGESVADSASVSNTEHDAAVPAKGGIQKFRRAGPHYGTGDIICLPVAFKGEHDASFYPYVGPWIIPIERFQPAAQGPDVFEQAVREDVDESGFSIPRFPSHLTAVDVHHTLLAISSQGAGAPPGCFQVLCKCERGLEGLRARHSLRMAVKRQCILGRLHTANKLSRRHLVSDIPNIE